jgi:hypothetical protein
MTNSDVTRVTVTVIMSEFVQNGSKMVEPELLLAQYITGPLVHVPVVAVLVLCTIASAISRHYTTRSTLV